jgi:hypothetical protein
MLGAAMQVTTKVGRRLCRVARLFAVTKHSPSTTRAQCKVAFQEDATI